MTTEKLINLFNILRKIDPDFTESGEIELDNLDWARLVYDEESKSVMVENEYCTRFDLDNLSESEIGVFEFELNNNIDFYKTK